jgi:GT2 family glycosyltransferase
VDVVNLRIAAVVPCHNRKDKTLRFLKVFAAQTYSHLDLILVDADSKDGTIDAVRSLAPDTIIVSVDANHYWTAATNVGVKYALERDYDYILTINDDCVIEPGYVASLVSLAEKSQVKILGSRIDYLTYPGLVWSLGMQMDWKGHLCRLSYRDCNFTQLPDEVCSAELLKTDVLPGDGTLIHRSVFEKVGLYQARFLPHYLSDIELTLRASRAGFGVWVAPQIVLFDDSPTPRERKLMINSQAPMWQQFTDRFFHIRSGENFFFRSYVVLKYCPMTLKPWAMFRRFLAMGNWLLQYRKNRKTDFQAIETAINHPRVIHR